MLFRLCLLVTCCLVPFASNRVTASWLYAVREVKPNVFVWVSDDVLDQDGDPQFDRAGTAGFIITEEGLVVVNTTNGPFHGRELLYEIRHRTELPVKYVIDTNSSGEQMLGNEVFVDQEATLLSSAKTQAEILQYKQSLADRLADLENWRLRNRMRGFHITPPTETFDNKMALSLGGQEIQLVTLLKNESGDDAAVYLPAKKVMFLGELFQNGYFPHIESRNINEWVGALRQVEKWDVEVYVPGHGEPGGKKELAEFRQFLEWFGKEVGTHFQEGKSVDEVKREVTPQATYRWHAPELVSDGVEAVYEQNVKAHPSKAGASQPTTGGPLEAQPPSQP
jgi:glyoxylase-like metal-dependent hydrolase (beta-lactamase superfamily II)